jgi:hypothetical protein
MPRFNPAASFRLFEPTRESAGSNIPPIAIKLLSHQINERDSDCYQTDEIDLRLGRLEVAGWYH